MKGSAEVWVRLVEPVGDIVPVTVICGRGKVIVERVSKEGRVKTRHYHLRGPKTRPPIVKSRAAIQVAVALSSRR